MYHVFLCISNPRTQTFWLSYIYPGKVEYEQKNMGNYQLVVTVVIKNCEPLVSGPEFAIDRKPALKKETNLKNYSATSTS